MNRKLMLIICAVIIVLLAFFSLFIIQNKERSKDTFEGSSFFPALDIVGGELSNKDVANIPIYLSNLSSERIVPKDISVRKNSYKKAYAPGFNGYTIDFIADVKKVRSSYNISIQYLPTTSMGVVAYCSSDQLDGYVCVDKTMIMESE